MICIRETLPRAGRWWYGGFAYRREWILNLGPICKSSGIRGRQYWGLQQGAWRLW
jgi:hypothetical protein